MEGRLAADVKGSMNRRERERASMEVMLDKFVFRCDDDAKRFPGNETTATAHTCIGVPFTVCVDLAPAPAISRLYLQWPGGPKPEAGRHCQLVAAHRGRLLLRFTSLFKSKSSPQDLQCTDDYFVYTPVVPGGKPSLALLPAWLLEEDREFYLHMQQERKEQNMRKACRQSPRSAEEDTPEVRWAEAMVRKKHEEQMALGVDVDQDIEPSSLIAENLGLVCCEDSDRFVVAELHRLRKMAANHEQVLAELSMFCSSDGGDPSSWELKNLPVDCHRGLGSFGPQAVVSFDSCLCWVDYRRGIVLADNVLEHKSPKLSYVPFPRPLAHSPMIECYDLHSGVCATDGGRLLKFVQVVANNQERSFEVSFAIITYVLTKTEAGHIEWVRDAAPPMTNEELWGLKAPVPVPHEVPMLPLVSMEKPHIIHFLLSEWTDYIDTLTLVTVDMDNRTVLSVRPYIKGEQELYGEDADLARARTSFWSLFSLLSSPSSGTRQGKYMNEPRIIDQLHHCYASIISFA